MNLLSVFILFPVALFLCGCASENIVNVRSGEAAQIDTSDPDVHDDDNISLRAHIDTSDIEYLKKLPVHLPDESPGHNDENVVGANLIKNHEAKKVFFEFINIIPSDYAAQYEFYSQRRKKNIESSQNIKSAEEYKRYWEKIEAESDPPPFKRIVEILDFSEMSPNTFYVKARDFGDTYPVKIDEYVQISEKKYLFVKEESGWKYDGLAE